MGSQTSAPFIRCQWGFKPRCGSCTCAVAALRVLSSVGYLGHVSPLAAPVAVLDTHSTRTLSDSVAPLRPQPSRRVRVCTRPFGSTRDSPKSFIRLVRESELAATRGVVKLRCRQLHNHRRPATENPRSTESIFMVWRYTCQFAALWGGVGGTFAPTCRTRALQRERCITGLLAGVLEILLGTFLLVVPNHLSAVVFPPVCYTGCSFAPIWTLTADPPGLHNRAHHSWPRRTVLRCVCHAPSSTGCLVVTWDSPAACPWAASTEQSSQQHLARTQVYTVRSTRCAIPSTLNHAENPTGGGHNTAGDAPGP